MKNTLHNTIKTSTVLAILGCVAFGNTKQAQAQTALNSVVASTHSLNNDWSLGWEFTLNNNINVTNLGVYDQNGDGLTSSHDVGIFRVSDGALLTSTTIVTTDTLDSGFRYKPVSNTLLTTGQSYRIAAVYTLGGTDQYPGISSYTADGAINFVTDRFTQIATLTNPTSTGGFTNAWLSSNFKFTSATAAPEPGTLALIIMGGMGVWGRYKRRK
jgi:hypothetical protein